MTRGGVALVLVVYVVPLLGVSGLLALAGLPGLALGLLAVEACVAGATALARRRPARPARLQPSRRPWLVPLAMVAVMGGVVGIAVLASHAG